MVRILAGLVLACLNLLPARAAEVVVISTLNVMPAFTALQAPFAASSGSQLVFRQQPAKPTEALAKSGAVADVTVGSHQMLERIMAAGQIKPGSIVDFASSSLGVFVKQGSPPLDVSDDAKLRQVLLGVPNLSYPDPEEGSLGGNYLHDLLGQWGMLGALGSKTILADGGADVGRIVASGRARIGLNQPAEVQMVPGLTFLSPLPPALTGKVVMSVGIASSVRNPAGAKAWIDFLTSPAAADALRAISMEPVPR